MIVGAVATIHVYGFYAQSTTLDRYYEAIRSLVCGKRIGGKLLCTGEAASKVQNLRHEVTSSQFNQISLMAVATTHFCANVDTPERLEHFLLAIGSLLLLECLP